MSLHRHCLASICAALLIAACGTVSVPTGGEPATVITPFSLNSPDAALPAGWQTWVINRAKKETAYDLVRESGSGTVVLHAVSNSSASGLMQRLDIDPSSRPIVAWRWRVADLIIGADNQDRYSEDSPVRLMLFFDGDRTALPFREQMLMETAELLSGQQVPFATLIYVWENRFPVDTVLANSFSGQIKLVVADSGADRLGRWHALERNYVGDYQRAFGKPPGRLVGVGIMTDTDNTGESIEAFYGDIELRPTR
jgi:hypothetical protein